MPQTVSLRQSIQFLSFHFNTKSDFFRIVHCYHPRNILEEVAKYCIMKPNARNKKIPFFEDQIKKRTSR